MAVYIELFHGLEKYTKQHLMYLAEHDTGLSFGLSDYVSPLIEMQSIEGDYISSVTRESRFIEVRHTETISSVGGALLSYLVKHGIPLGGVLLICPRGSNDIINLFDGRKKMLKELGGGVINFYDNSSTNTVDAVICYDASENWPTTKAGVNYVTKDVVGRCIPMYRHVILAHELAHASLMHSFSGSNPPSQAMLDEAEVLAIEAENIYREWIDLPTRDSSEVKETDLSGFCP